MAQKLSPKRNKLKQNKNRHTDAHSHTQTETNIHTQTDTRANKQTHIHKHTHTHTNRPTQTKIANSCRKSLIVQLKSPSSRKRQHSFEKQLNHRVKVL